MVSYGKVKVWEDIKIGDTRYMISVTKNNESFEVYLTDLIELWTEVLTKESILRKLRKLNALLNVDMLDQDEITTKLLSNISEHTTEASTEEIKLRGKIEGGFVKFNFNLAKATPQQFYEVITKPLCTCSVELLKEREGLIDVIKKKDAEIAEYKAEGAELIRKNIETKPFNEEQFQSALPLNNNQNCKSMFQATINYYNTLKPDRLDQIKHESSPRHASDVTEEITMMESTSGEISRAEGVLSNDSVKVKSKITSPKKGSSRVVYEPPKRRKKVQNNFLL